MQNCKKFAIGAAFAMAFIASTFSAPHHAQAQTVPDDSVPDVSLDVPIPGEAVMKNDPNNRSATAIVNGEIITGTDIDERMALVTANARAQIGDEEKAQLRLQILRNLIDETLQIQEAAANDITISDAEINQFYERTAQQNFGKSSAALTAHLQSIGSSPKSVKRQIMGELAWSRLLARFVNPFTNVSEEEVREAIERMKAAKGTEEYRLSEIYLSSNPENAQQVAANAQQILQQIQSNGNFGAFAQQFSEASSASVGGDLGWIRLSQLPTEIASAALQMQIGQLAGPVQIPGGFSILYLTDKRQILTADPRDAILNVKQLRVSFPADATKELAEKMLADFSESTANIKGCGQADEVAARIGADVASNNLTLRNLPPVLQEIFLNLNVGETTQPFGSLKDGLRVFVLCGRDTPETAGTPDFDKIMASMEDEKINKRAQTFLRDLRRDAVIEYN